MKNLLTFALRPKKSKGHSFDFLIFIRRSFCDEGGYIRA